MNLNSLKPLPPNNVLLKLKVQNDKILLKSGGFLYIDTSFNEYEHTETIAEVIKVPPVCRYRDPITGDGLWHEWPIEVEVGDTVYCHYLAIQSTLKKKYDGKSFVIKGKHDNEKGDIYCIIHYHRNIFMVYRNGQYIPINDYLIVERGNTETVTPGGLIIPESVQKSEREKLKWGTVLYAGKNLSSPLQEGFSDEDLHVGSKVFFHPSADIPLEYKDHQTFLPGRDILRIRRTDIWYVEND